MSHIIGTQGTGGMATWLRCAIKFADTICLQGFSDRGGFWLWLIGGSGKIGSIDVVPSPHLAPTHGCVTGFDKNAFAPIRACLSHADHVKTTQSIYRSHSLYRFGWRDASPYSGWSKLFKRYTMAHPLRLRSSWHSSGAFRIIFSFSFPARPKLRNVCLPSGCGMWFLCSWPCSLALSETP